MIDCVFQLLLFFLVASRFDDEARMTGEGSLESHLPEAAAAMPMVMRPKEMTVNVNAKGEYFVGGELHSEQQLADRLERGQINNPGTQTVIIRGDQKADWKSIARVMGLCNKANIKDYRVAVIDESQTPQTVTP